MHTEENIIQKRNLYCGRRTLICPNCFLMCCKWWCINSKSWLFYEKYNLMSITMFLLMIRLDYLRGWWVVAKLLQTPILEDFLRMFWSWSQF